MKITKRRKKKLIRNSFEVLLVAMAFLVPIMIISKRYTMALMALNIFVLLGFIKMENRLYFLERIYNKELRKRK